MKKQTYKPFENPKIELLGEDVRCRINRGKHIIIMDRNGVYFKNIFYSWNDAFYQLELSYDNGITWQPFGEVCNE